MLNANNDSWRDYKLGRFDFQYGRKYDLGQKNLDKKELFKDCQKFQDAFEEMVVIVIMNFNS